MWMVRAGKKAAAVDGFLEEGVVAIGWNAAAELPLGASRAQVQERMQVAAPGKRPAQLANAVGQIFRFLSELRAGDYVCTVDPGQRRYCIGKLKAGEGHREHQLARYREVDWALHASRDALTSSTRNSLGAIMTLFRIPSAAADELLAKAIPIDSPLGEARKGSVGSVPGREAPEADPGVPEESSESFEDVALRASELIEDGLVRLDWEELQELVAGILRGMGYRAQVSPKGSDRGVDVFASPDGLGLEEPRIFVEVKHRPGSTMGAPELRAFLGGRQAGDRCLYVSTGGFTKEARYEAERSTIPVTLIDLPRLGELLVEHYARLDSATMALVPLQALYWPVGS